MTTTPAPAAEGLSAQEATTTNANKVQAHSSRWDYPKEFKAPEGSKTHTVEKGDTLWDLAERYLGAEYAPADLGLAPIPSDYCRTSATRSIPARRN